MKSEEILAKSLDEILLMGRTDIVRNMLEQTKRTFDQYDVYMNRVRSYENKYAQIIHRAYTGVNK